MSTGLGLFSSHELEIDVLKPCVHGWGLVMGECHCRVVGVATFKCQGCRCSPASRCWV